MIPTTIDRSRAKRLCLSLLVCLLVASAGCSSLLGASDGPTADAPTSGQPTTTRATTAPATTTTATDTTAATTTPNTETSDGHDHDTTTVSDDANASATGQMAIAVEGRPVSLTERVGTDPGSFWIDADADDVWHADGDPTLAAALSEGNLSLTGSSLTLDGETYSEGTDGTVVAVRVNGEPVDPESYHLADSDEVWVTVETASMNVSVPGTYIHEDHLHIHGSMNVTVDGERVDFSRPNYQSADRYFHFEGGEANPWHAHSDTITLSYALGTLPGINATEDTVTYENETYADDDPGTDLTVTVNGESVDPTDYYLKDGDSVRVVVRTDD